MFFNGKNQMEDQFLSPMQLVPLKDSQGESLLRCAGLCIHSAGCDLVVMNVTCCRVIVPLMTLAYVFGAGFVQSQSF